MNPLLPSQKRTIRIMGILNITPDSFYDGGIYVDTEAAVSRATMMKKEGADIIDIGGESALETDPVSEAEERERIMPVIRALSKKDGDMLISVDTHKSSIAEEALKEGAWMINDITAGRQDPHMFQIVAAAQCPYVMMYNKDDSSPARRENRRYDDIMESIGDFFEERIDAAVQAGIGRNQIIIDPGLGHFISSDPAYSWEILERLDELKHFGCPILVSPSRKSFTAEYPDQPASERLPGTLKATRLAINRGASIIRTHDVVETRKAVSWEI